MITEETVIDKIEILENGTMQVRRNRRVMDGLEILAEKFQRAVYTPDTNIATLPPKIAAIANVVWTPFVISNYLAAKAAQDAKPLGNP